jgi:translation initiation factor IF-3
MVGVVAIKDARKMADDAGLDLVEISPNAEPPVCKVMDYSKYKYEQQKKAAEARKKQKVIEVKEVKIRPNTEEHDYQVKFKAAKRFLEEGNKVKISIRFRGREVTHKEIGEAMMHRLRDDLAEFSKVDLSPKMEGRQMLMILSSSVVKP